VSGIVEIAGGIASGKTTLARSLAAEGFKPVFEAFESNPFLRLFYADPARVAFETEVSFMLLHAAQALEAATLGTTHVADFSLLLDAAYADTTLQGRQRNLALEVLDTVRTTLPRPVAIVLLECPAEEELRRIRRRGRDFEVSIELAYLDRVGEALRSRVAAQRDAPVITVDSSKTDFRVDASTIAVELRSRLAPVSIYPSSSV
jgi:deoxyadenosine/deoxycytidine kinase